MAWARRHRWDAVLVACGVAMGAIGCGGGASPAEPPPAPRASAWLPFASVPGRFRITMPATPTEDVQQVSLPDDGAVETHLFTAEAKDPFGLYSVGYTDYPPDVIARTTPDAMLDGAIEGAVRNVSGEVLASRTITVGGHPGRHVEATVPKLDNGRMAARYILAGDRLYVVMMVTHDDRALAGANGWLESFELTTP